MRTSVHIIFLILALLAAGIARSDERPNFLVIVTDDLGFTDLGAFGGHDIQTPNLDQLALEGIRFTNFHGHARCAASRALLMTGTGNHEAGFGTVVNIEKFRGQRGYEQFLTKRVVTLPEILRAGGYRTYLAGKWDLKVQPSRRGFDRSMAILRGGSGHYEAINPWVRYTRNGERVVEPAEPTYSTTLFADAMISFLEEDRTDDRPYFALFAPSAPHWPLHSPPGMRDAYAGEYDDGYEALREQRVRGAEAAAVLPEGIELADSKSRAPPWRSLGSEEKKINARVMEIYAAMTTHLDAEVGRLLEALRELGALENTLIMYINDNGAEGGPIFRPPQSEVAASKTNNNFENLGASNSWAHMGQGWAEAVNAPFRDTKGSVYEGALRVAAFAHWVGADHSESINRQYLDNMDLMPTLLELAGISHPAPRFHDREVLPMRGKSFAGILRGDSGIVHTSDQTIALSTAGRHFMYRGNLKLLKELGSDWELYDLAADPYEQHNLAGARPELLQELLVEFKDQAAKSNILDR